MYKIAEQNAQWVPFAKHPLMKATNKQKKTDYIILLLYCLSLDKGEIVNGLTFICWLKNKLEVDTTIQTLYMQVLKIKADFFRKAEMLQQAQKESLMLDCMIIIALNGGVKAESSYFLADMMMNLNLEESKIVEWSILAKVVVGHGYENLSWQEVSTLSNTSKKYSHYLNPSNLKYFKREIDTLPIQSIKNGSYRQLAPNGKKVKKGQVLAGYISKKSRANIVSDIKAKRDGISYLIKLKDKYYFIITQEGDSRQKIIEHLKQEESK